MKKISRRTFLAGVAAASAAAVVPKKKAVAAVREDSWATLIDLTKCDGCKDKETPACVGACRTSNKTRFPEPDPAMLKPYWPQPFFEDYSTKRGIKDRLTPYNWTFVQKVQVEHEGEMVEVAVPRRCMHCDSPACSKICPFGVNQKEADGPVHIDPFLCFGGAKCRTVCPWNVPQRQAGVGVYTYLDPMPVGGGVMFKCDLCYEKLREGETPACIPACPNNAMKIGKRSDIFAEANALKEQYNGFVYGDKQNGGTSTLYVSKVPFEKIDKAIVEQVNNIPDPKKKKQAKNFIVRMHNPENMLEKHTGLAGAVLAAPIIGAVGAFAATVAKEKDND